MVRGHGWSVSSCWPVQKAGRMGRAVQKNGQVLAEIAGPRKRIIHIYWEKKGAPLSQNLGWNKVLPPRASPTSQYKATRMGAMHLGLGALHLNFLGDSVQSIHLSQSQAPPPSMPWRLALDHPGDSGDVGCKKGERLVFIFLSTLLRTSWLPGWPQSLTPFPLLASLSAPSFSPFYSLDQEV